MGVANRLAGETSPYLRQHADNPVDWYPWGDEAFARAAELDRPIFLSVGYSACHWCHVMAHESFADEELAARLNRVAVPVKVDREERPDVDAVYMEAVLAATGHGGWPMSVFATPDGRPFFVGTYFPPEPRGGQPSFAQVIAAVEDAWTSRRAEVERQADAFAQAVRSRSMPPPPVADPGETGASVSREAVARAVAAACDRLGAMADRRHGGFGSAPKFPQPLLVDLLLRAGAAGVALDDGSSAGDLALEALEAMASGGIYDHLGGGFARYSVDDSWSVPHFEKMLYDQALLARTYLHAWQVTGDERWRQVLDETLGYVLRDLAHPDGGLCAAEDADSEGEEGRFYLWEAGDFATAAGTDLATAAAQWYGVTPAGNFEGRTVLHLARRGAVLRPPEIEAARARLEAARATRVRPGLDDKVLVEWNAMACSVLAEAAAATGSDRYASSARDLAAVLFAGVEAAGGVVRRLVGGTGEGPPGFAADAAWLAEAAVRVYELTGAPGDLARARAVADQFVDRFLDRETGLVYTTEAGGRGLIVRPVELGDQAVPAASSTGALALARLGLVSGELQYLGLARAIVEAASTALVAAPASVPELLHAAELVTGSGVEVVATGSARELLGSLRRRFLPHAVFALEPEEPGGAAAGLPIFEGREGDRLFVCRGGACGLPVTTVAGALDQLAMLGAVVGGSRP